MNPLLTPPPFKGLRKIILSRPDRIGDVVITTSCFEAVKERFPEVNLSLLVRAKMIPLLRGHPAIDGFIPAPERNRGDKEATSRLKESFRKIAPDCIVFFHHEPNIHQAALEEGIPLRIGYGNSWNGVRGLTHARKNRKRKGLQHEAFYNFDLLEFLGIKPPKEPCPQLHPDAKMKDGLPNLLPWWKEELPFAVFHLTAHGNKMRLPASPLSALARLLLPTHQILIIGSERGDRTAENFKEKLPLKDNVWDLTGRTSLSELAWILEKAKLLIARDSGPAHIGAAMGCPTLVIMGPHGKRMTARRWKPLGKTVRAIEKKIPPRSFESVRHYQERYFASVTEEEIKRELQFLSKELIPD